jgi:Signal transduction histidine kinase
MINSHFFAFKFAVKSTVTIDQNKDWTIMSIRHSGIGLVYSDAKHLFDPFFKTSYAKEGLELTLAQAIILQHEGRLTVESELGIGTEFIIEIPTI